MSDVVRLLERRSMQAMACFAHCATVVGVLAEPILVPVAASLIRWICPAAPLASLHGPPESHPPKSSILI